MIGTSVEIGPPSLLRELGPDNWFKACWLADGRSLAAPENARFRVLLVDAERPHGHIASGVPFLSPPSTFSPDLHRRQPGWTMGGGGRLEGARDSRLEPSAAPTREVASAR